MQLSPPTLALLFTFPNCVGKAFAGGRGGTNSLKIMTTQTKHTPGPWKVEQSGNAEFVSAEYGESRVRIAEVYQAENSYGALVPCECEANAALIAQAPDLLRQRDKLREALQRILSRLNHYTCEIESCELPAADELAIDQARAILAETEAKP